MLPTDDDDDCSACSPAGLSRRSLTSASVSLLVSSLPFLISFLFVATLVFQRLFPLLTSTALSQTAKPQHAQPRSRSSSSPLTRLSAITFSTTIALALVLAELILCEISDALPPAARGAALRLTVALLLALLVVVIPLIEIYSLISAVFGWRYTGPSAGRLKLAWVMHALVFGGWLLGFWWSGRIIRGERSISIPGGRIMPGVTVGKAMGKGEGASGSEGEGWLSAAVEHVGVVGISLMALLSGFASVSAPWQSFGAKRHPVSEASLERKRVGLESTNEMLAVKRSRLRAVEQKISKAPAEGLLQKGMGMFRGGGDVGEKKSLEMEIGGLENMAVALSSQYSMMQGRWGQQELGKTHRGRLVRTAGWAFSVYCLYRVATTMVTFVRRRWASEGKNVGSDPINSILALLVKTYDSQLDREAWTRQISFLLSGVMLCASISSVMQTFHFFSRYTPGLLRAAQANLPLLVAQLCATYVISVALLLRGIMPGEVVSDRLRSLGGNDMQWVDRWFEEWFLGGVVVTVVGIWASKKIVGSDDWDDDDVELGKLH
jgi:hypothetical protein